MGDNPDGKEEYSTLVDNPAIRALVATDACPEFPGQECGFCGRSNVFR